MRRLIPLLLILAACEQQPAHPCVAPDGGTPVRVVHPELLTYTDAKALCEAAGARLAVSSSWDDRSSIVSACQAQGTDPCWTDDWGTRSAAEGGGVGPVAVAGGVPTVVPSGDLSTYLAHPVCETAP